MKNILITGCSTGIGFETALYLKQNGIKVYATARKNKDVKYLRDFGLEVFKLDVRDSKQISHVLDKIIKNDMKLDAVFNNAGYGQPGAVEDVSVKTLRKQFETNVFGLHEVNLQALKIFRKQGYGKIINHSSVLGIISLRFRGAYNASKYAIEGLSDTLRLETHDDNIFISSINTGPVTSKFRENALKKFNKNIDIQNSHFKTLYEEELKGRLEKKEDTTPFTLPANSVAKVVLKIMNTNKPKPRYYVTKATYILGYLKRILSTSLLDKILVKI